MSSDGRYVVFYSLAGNLVPDVEGGTYQVYLRDTWRDETTLISRSTAGEPANGGSDYPSISSDGRYVVFMSWADNLVVGDTNGTDDVFLRDLQMQTTERVSLSPAGEEHEWPSEFSSLSTDGRYIVYENYDGNIYLRDRGLSTTITVTVGYDGSPANDKSLDPVISPDGRFVVFSSEAYNLVEAPVSWGDDIYLYDTTTGQTSLVSVTYDGNPGNGKSRNPKISADGRYVAFDSSSTNLIANDTNYNTDVFVRDLIAGETILASLSWDGIQAKNGYSEAPSISADGRYVAFQSRATNLVPGGTTQFNTNVYLRDLVDGATTLISKAPDGTEGNDVSTTPSLSLDGRFIAFTSSASNLVPDDIYGMEDVFLYGPDLAFDEITPLTLGEPRTDDLTLGEIRLYSVDVALPEGVLLIQVRPLAAIEGLDVSARLGSLPQVGLYDVRALSPNPEGAFELVIDPTVSGTFYVRVKGTGVVLPVGSYEIMARWVTRHLSDVQPRSAGNAGTTTLNIRGVGLDQAVEMRLQGSGLPTLVGEALTAPSPTELWSGFDLAGAVVGTYDVAIEFADGEVLTFADGFQVTPGTGGRLETYLVVPDLSRADRTYTAWVEYANVGDADLPAPLLVVSTSPALPMKTQNSMVWLDGTVHLLGVNPGEPAGILPPGARGRIPIMVTMTRDTVRAATHLEVLEATPGAIDWDPYALTMRPEGITEAEWWTLWPTVQERLGSTWQDYLTVLGSDATRLRPRGVDVYDVRQLLAFEIRRAAGEPVAAVTGRVLDLQTGNPITATQVLARHEDGLAVRAEPSDPRGNFTVGFLPDGVYELYVEGYVVTPTLTVTLTQEADANAVVVHASAIPPEPELPPPLVQYAAPQVLDVAGTPHLVFSVDGQIYHTTYTDTTWTAATPISGAYGIAPRLLYAPDLLDGTDPGLALFWRTDTANDAAIAYAAARQDGLGGWAWSEAAIYTDTIDAGSTNPVAVVDDEGMPVVVWQMVDFEDPNADTDLYYGHEPVVSTVLSWDEIEGLLVLDRPAHLDDGTVLPAGAVVALTDGGEAVLVDTGTQAWEESFSLGFTFNKNGTVPRFVPYIGGRNSVELSAALSGTAMESGALASASLGGSLKMMQDRVTGSVGGSLEAAWALDTRACTFNLNKATLSASLGAQGRFPIPQMTWEDPIFNTFKTEVGVQVGGSLSGALIWKAQGGAWPEGEVSGLLSLGFYGSVQVLGLVEGAVSGTGNVKATIGAKSFGVSDIYFLALAEAMVGPVQFTTSFRYPPSPGMLTAYGATLEEAIYAALEEGMEVTTTVTLQEKPGTTTVYGPNAVLTDVDTDRVDDGIPHLVLGSDGLSYLFWHRESGDLGATLGNTLAFATYDGTAWTALQTLTGTLGFGREPHAVVNTDGSLLVVWVHADADGWTMASDPNAVVEAYRDAEIRWATLHPDGTWSPPATLTGGPGDYHHLRLEALPSGAIWATWLETGSEDATLYAAGWDGAAWASAQIVTTGEVQGHGPAFALTGDTPSVVWAQGTDDPALPFSQAARLLTSTFNGTAWSTPVTLSLELLPPAGSLLQSALGADAATGASFRLPVTIPPELCEPIDPDKPNPNAFEDYEEPDESPDPPDGALDVVDEAWTENVWAWDPNEKVGPRGFGTARWIDGSTPLAYTIYFENKEEALAPAQQVVISDTLDADLDWSSLIVTEVAFGDQVLPVIDGIGGAYLLVDIADYRPEVTRTWQVEVIADLDHATGAFTVVMTTLDPETGEFPDDPLAGFLPPNDETGRGEGRVSFMVMADAGLASGTLISNQAEIVFDTEAPISTNAWLNTIGTAHVLTTTAVGDGSILRTPWEDAYFPDQPITLTAVADPGWAFIGWSGDTALTTNPLTITIEDDTTITATFRRTIYIPLVMRTSN